MFKDLLFSYGTMISICGFIVVATAFYWKMRIDLKAIDIKIVEIQCDRKERWSNYEKKQEKQDACLLAIMEGIKNMSGDIRAIKTDINWLKKN